MCAGSTSLHRAVSQREQEVAIILVNRGADRCIRDGHGKTAAQLAKEKYMKKLAQTIGHCWTIGCSVRTYTSLKIFIYKLYLIKFMG